MNDKSISEFWKWFRSNWDELSSKEANDVVEILFDKINSIISDVTIEVGNQDSEINEIIISANGDFTKFDKIKKFVNKAPEIKGCTIYALKPAQGFDFMIEMNQVTLSAKLLYFDPMTSKTGREMGILLYVPIDIFNLPENKNLLWKVIETGIGEEAGARIGKLDVESIENKPIGALPITDLGRYSSWFYAKRN